MKLRSALERWKEDKMSEGKKRIFPEIDARLYDRIKALAEKNKRTVSRQLECFIEDFLK